MCQSVSERIAHRISIFRRTQILPEHVFKLGKAPTAPTLKMNPNSKQQSRWPQGVGSGAGKSEKEVESGQGFPAHVPAGVEEFSNLFFSSRSRPFALCFVGFTFQVRQNKLLMEIHAFGIIDFSAFGGCRLETFSFSHTIDI